MAPERYTGKVVEKRHLTSDIVLLRIALNKHQEFHYRAGQFLRLEVQVLPKPAGAVVRTYSMAAAPIDPTHVELIIRHVPGGMCSTWIVQTLAVKDPVAFAGPMGNFHLSGSGHPVIAIAGGSGMSAIRAILQDMHHPYVQRQTYFFFGARTRQDLYLVEEWHDFMLHNPWFHFIPVLSDEPPGPDWTGARGLVTDAVLKQFECLSLYEGYLCGSPGMVDTAIRVLMSRGMLQQHIFYDRFTV